MKSNLATVLPDPDDQPSTEIDHFKQDVERLEQRAKTLTITDDTSEEAALMFIAECKGSYNRMEEERTKKVKPLNDQVKEINAAFKPFTEILDRLWRATDQERSTYLRKKQEAIDAANRKAIADAEQARLAEEQKAAAARQAAADAREAGDEKTAIKLEAKADKAETKAMMTAPVLANVTPSTGTRSLMSGATAGTRKTVDWFFENGMAKEGDYYQDDPRVKDIPARYFLLDLSKLGRDAKNGVPIPGVKKTEGFATTVKK
jgi:hypothetical protein